MQKKVKVPKTIAELKKKKGMYKLFLYSKRKFDVTFKEFTKEYYK